MIKREFKDINFDAKNPYEIEFDLLPAGEYKIRIIHKNENIYLNKKSLFLTFHSDSLGDNNLLNILGFRSFSEKHGIFKYIGGGSIFGDYILQEFSFKTLKNIENFLISVKSFIPGNAIDIDCLQIYDASIPEFDLFFKESGQKIFFSKQTLSDTVFNILNHSANIEKNKVFILSKNLDRESILEKISKILEFNKNIEFFVFSKDDLLDELLDGIPSCIKWFSMKQIDSEILFDDEKNYQFFVFNKNNLDSFSYLFVDDDGLFKKLSSIDYFTKKIFKFDVGFLKIIDDYIESKRDDIIHIDDFEKGIACKKNNKIIISFDSFNKTEQNYSNLGLISIVFKDMNGETLLPSDDFAINSSMGAYKYIHSGSFFNPEKNEIEISVPNDEKISYVTIKGCLWEKDKGYVYICLSSLSIVDGKDDVVFDSKLKFINELNSEDKIILMYTTAPYVGHETLELRPNRLTKEYIKLGYKVVFFAFSKVPNNMEYPDLYNGKLLQCHKDDLNSIISLVSKVNLKEKLFICSSFPDIFALTSIEFLNKMNDWKIVYEIRDDMEEFNRVGYSKWYSTQLELKVAKLADRIVTVSPRLAQKIKILCNNYKNNSWSKKVKVIQNAAPDTLIARSEYLRSSVYFEQKSNSNIVGYIGHLTPAWFDWTLLFNAAKDFPNLDFEIIGHGMPVNLQLPPNVKYLGPKTHSEFLEISERWKIGLIPFIASPLTYGVDPNKIYEYLAANLLVVTADMGSVRDCPATYVYSNYEEFKEKLLLALSVTYNSNLSNDIINYVEQSRWSNRAQAMINFINEDD